MHYKLRFRSNDEASAAALYLDDRCYDVKLMGSALMVGPIDVADLAVVQVAYAAWIDENVTDFDRS